MINYWEWIMYKIWYFSKIYWVCLGYN